MGLGFRNLSEYLRFQGLPEEQRRLVVYSEGSSSWPHLGPVVQELLRRPDVTLTYVSSSKGDPGVALQHPRLTTLVIGDGHVRTLFFSALKAELVLMTMPDLNTFHIKRSAQTRCYAYLHHSVVSSHMVYRPGAFDHFDAVLCVGPHHEAELRAMESAQGGAPKTLLRHGYARIDALLAESAGKPPPSSGRPVVVVAPSWGPNGLLERHADALMSHLAHSDWDVVVRPHPQTARLAPGAMACVAQWCSRASNVRLDSGASSHRSLLEAHLMVSDWSGAAFDFALGCERPVLFVDVPRKVNNPGYESVGIEPIESFARGEIGRVLGEHDLPQIPALLRQLLESGEAHRRAIRAFRQRWVYNVGHSARVAADSLLALLER